MTRARRRDRSHDDLVAAAGERLPEILMFYERFQENRPVMLLDLPSGTISAYPYEDFKAELSPRSQAPLTADYEKALAQDKIVVFVRDHQTRRLVSLLFDHE
jgi:hypothetical protein